MTTYKVSQPDAQAMATAWYNMVPSVTNSVTPAQLAQGAAHWATEIQQDGSNSAFQDFSNSIGKQHGAQATAELASNAAAYTKSTGLPPWTPAQGAVNGQYPGTNTRTAGNVIGKAITSPVGQIVESVIAGALDVASGGALVPLTTAGEAAVQGLGAGLQPGANFGSIAGSALKGAGEGALAGTGAGLLNSATGGALVAGSAVPDAATMSPSALAAAANATPSAVTSALPGASTVLGLAKGVAGAAGAGSGSSGGAPGGILSFLGSNPLLTGLAVAQGANVTALGQKASDYADQAANDATQRWDAQAPLRTAGIAGMLNPTSPYSAPAIPGGNPFAPKPTASTSTNTSASPTTPTGSGISAMLSPTTPAPTTPTTAPIVPPPVSALPKPPVPPPGGVVGALSPQTQAI